MVESAGDAAPETAGSAPDNGPTLGEWLAGARVRAGLTLAEAERGTRINGIYLEAIEAGRLEVLPAPIYARGFVRAYARYLGLDEARARELLPDDMPRPQGLEPPPGLRRTRIAALPSFNGARVLAALAAVLLVIAVALAIAWFAGGGPGDGEEAATAQEAATATVTAGAVVPPFEPGEAPDFSGVPREVAEQVLTDLGLPFVVIEVATREAPEGRVFGQAPQPGAPVEPGDDVTIVVSAGPPP